LHAISAGLADKTTHLWERLIRGGEIIRFEGKSFHQVLCSGSVEELEQGFEQWEVVFKDNSHWI
jgi:hypothetical protein